MSSEGFIQPTEDRISTFPDSILCHILSFLPTNQSAATTILSKRWYQLWLSVLSLHFDDQNFTTFASFQHFVSSVMRLRNITLPLLSYRLKCGNSSGFNSDNVNKFIETALQRRVPNLNLEIWPPTVSRFVLPPCVFNYSNLTVLKLKWLTMDDFSNFNFPLLKTLHLDKIYFYPLRTSFLGSFLYGCPNLENFQIQDPLFLDYYYGEFNGLLKLEKANIFNSTTWNFPFDWVRNAKFLRAKLYSAYNYEATTFLNLTHMEIVFERQDEWLGKWNWLIEVILYCPKLQNLTIHEDSRYGHKIGNVNWVEPRIVPRCLSYELRTCSLKAIKGRKHELQFAEYILKNAKALHTMKISAARVDLNMEHEMLMKLSLCPRGSTRCELSFD